MVLKVALFGSGEGSSIEFVLNSLSTGLLNKHKIELVKVVTLDGSPIIDKCEKHGIFNYMAIVNPGKLSTDDERHVFEQTYRHFWFDSSKKPDVIVLLGWKYILSKNVLEYYTNEDIRVLNLHPSLPGSFVGNNCVEKMFNAYKQGSLNTAGSMIHDCTPTLDRGNVVDKIEFKIKSCGLHEFRQQVKFHEKTLILRVMNKLISKYNISSMEPFYRGKVRDLTDMGYGLLLMNASNRVSAFDRHLAEVPTKGKLLNSMSAWWFGNTRHIIDNHYLYHHDSYMVVKKCVPIKLEVVVRAYMTGSSSTSIWKQYTTGKRDLYGIHFRDGYKKNEKLDTLVITPTTKGIVDEPLTKEDIVDMGYLTVDQCDFIYEKALALFKYGSLVASSKGLLLVDTKYEFGIRDTKIMLMDELHTCDSSRYWQKDTYYTRFSNGDEPDKFDKDCIRDYVKKTYSDKEIKTLSSVSIPNEVIVMVNDVYSRYHQILTGSVMYQPENNELVDELPLNVRSKEFIDAYFKNHHKDRVVIIAGSTSDMDHVEKIKNFINEENIYCECHYKSAHKNTREVLEIIDSCNSATNKRIIFVTVAGRSNALSGVVASNTRYPVIACPPFKDKMDMFTNINSTLQCPGKVPVLACLEPGNVAICVRNIFKL